MSGHVRGHRSEVPQTQSPSRWGSDGKRGEGRGQRGLVRAAVLPLAAKEEERCSSPPPPAKRLQPLPRSRKQCRGGGRQTLRNARKFDGAAEERLFPLLLSDPRQLNAG